MRIIEMSGMKFGRYTVLHRDTSHHSARPKWICECECGEVRSVVGNNLRRGKSTSCGCYSRELTSKSSTTHGLSKTNEYSIWAGVKQRCTDKNNKKYPAYGGKGISICDDWLNSFENFINDMGMRPSTSHSIDRINNDGSYNRDNCRWATSGEQNRNKHNIKMISHNGKTLCVSDWANEIGITPHGLHERLNKGMSIHDSLTTPVRVSVKS